MAVTSIRYSTAPARKKPKAGDRRFLKGRQVWQVRQQKIVNHPLYGWCRLVSSGRPVWEWVDEGSDEDREHQWRKRLEQMRASTAQQGEGGGE